MKTGREYRGNIAREGDPYREVCGTHGGHVRGYDINGGRTIIVQDVLWTTSELAFGI